MPLELPERVVAPDPFEPGPCQDHWREIKAKKEQ